MIGAIAGLLRESITTNFLYGDIVLKYRLMRNGKLPLESKEDLLFFSQVTKGDAVVMGRKTWETLPKSSRPLSKRENYILSNQPSKTFLSEDELYNPSIHHVYGLKDDKESIKSFLSKLEEKHGNVWIIGGAEIYKLFAPYVDNLIMTTNFTINIFSKEDISENTYVDFPIESFDEMLLMSTNKLVKLDGEIGDIGVLHFVPLRKLKENLPLIDLKSKTTLLVK